jgi:hypothetical protein
MNRSRLTISSSLQIYFDQDGAARYSPADKALGAVEAEVSEWQAFVDRWLDNVQSPAEPRRPTPEEERLSNTLKQMVRSLKRGKLSKEVIIPTVRAAASRLRTEWGAPNPEQTEQIAAEVIDTAKL